jgi:CHAD domain-containing protein
MAERELKLLPRPGFTLGDLHGLVDGLVPGPAEVVETEATYYDTPDLRLTRAGASLRHRSDEGWVVKLPAGPATELLVRDEHRFAGPPGEPPAGAVDLVRAFVRRAPLRPVIRLRTRRRRVVLHRPDGTPALEVTHDDVLVVDDGRITGGFREVEIEVHEGGDPHLARALARRLAARGGDGGGVPLPKVARALGFTTPPEPEVPAPGSTGAATVAQLVQAAIAASVHRLVAHDPGVRLGGDPEFVHQARVATRRLRSDLRTLRPVLDPTWADRLRDELAWLGAELGVVRDTEVLLELLRGKVVDAPAEARAVGQAVVAELTAREAAQREALRRSLRTERYLTLLDHLVEAARNPAVLVNEADRPAVELARLVRRPWRRLRRAVRAVGPDPADDELHRIRILAKRARYAAEAVAPAVGEDARRFARAVARLQEVLGTHHDAVVARAFLAEHLSGVDRPADAWALGLLAGMVVADEQAARRSWPAAWGRCDRRRLRRWMRPPAP